MNFLLSLLLIGADMTLPSYYTPAPYSEDVIKVELRTIKEIQKATPLSAVGEGSSMMDSIKMIHLAFEIKKELTIDQAREYVMYCADILLKNVNNEEKIAQYLEPYPFTPNNIQIALFVKEKHLNNATLEDLRIILLKNGVLKYTSLIKEKYKSKVLHKETYEEALQLVDLENFPRKSKKRFPFSFLLHFFQ